MSTSAVRRTKERSGSVGRVVPPAASSKTFKTLSPVPFTNSGGGEALRKSSGTENLRNTSRGRASTVSSQKPVVLPMPRIDRTSVVSQGEGKDPRLRRSTSSVSRGRSSSPSDFSRALSDMRRVRVSNDRTDKRLQGDSEVAKFIGGKSTSRVRASDVQIKGSVRLLKPKSSEIDGRRHVLEKSRSINGRGKDNPESIVLDGSKTDNDLSSNQLKSCYESSSVQRTNMDNHCVDLGVIKQSGVKASISSKVSEVPKQKVLPEEASGGRSNKYSSNLHEKLAFLEGKVKRIASDIKRTKEMLDHNNKDTSKFILSDIQEKISGIEKAMCHVGITADAKTHVTKAGDIDNGVHNARSSVKGLSTEELEARLFPHHRLLRDRSSLGLPVGSSIESQANGSCLQSKPEEKSFSLIDGNYLASINKENPSKVTMRGEYGSLQSSDIHETDVSIGSETRESSSETVNTGFDQDIVLANQFDNQVNKTTMMVEDETDDSYLYKLHDIGSKTSTGGWFVSDGEAVLLAHTDNSCSFYDIVNCEGKAEYKPPVSLPPNLWRDCWIIRAPGSDGCVQRYVVVASAGNTMESGFCSWDFYTKAVKAFHVEEDNAARKRNRTALAPVPNNNSNCLSSQQWWYKPCGPLMVSAASCQKSVRIYDIRDGEELMSWEVQKPILTMDYSSSLQWRNREKIVVAESEAISLWDVNSPSSHALVYVRSPGKRITALHVNHTDAEPGSGVRQRVSSSEAEGHDGVFCTPDLINVLDFRTPSGVGIKMPKLGIDAHCVYSRGDSVYIGCVNSRRGGRIQPAFSSQIKQFSLRKQRMTNDYKLFPEADQQITQVWGNSNFVMGVCGTGLYTFDASNDDVASIDSDGLTNAREVIGPENMYSPTFDYLSSRVLLISRDRPAVWSHF